MAIGSDELVLFLRAQTGEFKAKMGEARGEVTAMGASGKSNFSKFQAAGSAAFLAVGVAAVAFGVKAVEMATEGQQVHAQLVQAIKNTGHGYNEYGAQVEEASHKLEKFGFTNTDVEESITVLTRATKSASKATELQGLTADIARARHLSLADAAGLLAKVELGRYSILTRLGVASKDQVANIHNEHQATQLLAGLYGGAAQANAATFGGKIEALKAQFHNLTEEAGNALIPVIESLVSHAVDAVQWMQAANDATGGWAGRILLLGAGGAFAVIGIAKLVSGVGSLIGAVGSGVGAMASFGQSLALWAMYNPLLATGIGALAVGAIALVTTLGILSNKQDAVTKTAHAWTDAIRQQGVTLGEVSGQALSDWISKHEDAQQVMERSGVTAADLQTAIEGDQGAYRRVTAALDAYRDSQHGSAGANLDATFQTDALRTKVDELRGSFGETKRQVEAGNKTTGDLKHAQLDATASTGQLTDKTKDNTAATADNTTKKKSSKDIIDALVGSLARAKIGFDNEAKAAHKTSDETKALTQHLKDLTDATLASANSDIRQQQSILQVGDAMRTAKEKTDALAHAKKGDQQASSDAAAAQLSLRSALLDAVGAAEANAEATDQNRKAHGQNITSVQIENDKHAAAKHALDVLSLTYPRLSNMINEYRLRLDLIPRSVDTQVNTHFNNVGGAPAVRYDAGGRVIVRAAGGPVSAGRPYLVGERGPEMFTPGMSGNITPNNRLSGDNSPIHITVEFDGKVFARAMVDQSNRQGGLPIRIRVPS